MAIGIYMYIMYATNIFYMYANNSSSTLMREVLYCVQVLVLALLNCVFIDEEEKCL